MRKLLKIVVPKFFNDGLDKCNNLGKSLICNGDYERFLDIGCGDGELTLEFAKILKAKEIYGIEIVDEYKLAAEKKGINCISLDLNDKWDLNNNFFDFILSSQNIEYVHNTRLYLEECYRCLKPGGQLLVLTENLASWANVVALALGWQPFSTTNINGWSLGNPFIWHIDEDKDLQFINKCQDSGVSGTVGHVRVLAYKGLFDLLRQVGFEKTIIKTTGYLPLWGKLSEILCKIDKKHGHFLIATTKKPLLT